MSNRSFIIPVTVFLVLGSGTPCKSLEVLDTVHASQIRSMIPRFDPLKPSFEGSELGKKSRFSSTNRDYLVIHESTLLKKQISSSNPMERTDHIASPFTESDFLENVSVITQKAAWNQMIFNTLIYGMICASFVTMTLATSAKARKARYAHVAGSAVKGIEVED